MDGGGANDFNEGEELRDEDAPNENFNCDSNTNNITGTTQENSSTNAQLYNLSVPAAAEFDTALLLFHYCQSHAKLNGYAVSIKRSNKERNITVKCDFGGNYRAGRKTKQVENRRKTVTRLQNCPFEIHGKIHPDKKWRFIVKCQYHNHEATPPSAHPAHKRLREDQLETAVSMTQAGARPRAVFSSLLNNDPDTVITLKSLYNAKAKKRVEMLKGRSPLHALLQSLHESDWEMNFLTDDNDQLQALFFAHPESIKLSRSYNAVLVMDCTYKTNRYKMSLLNVVGVSSFNTTFFVAFAFIQEEKEHLYSWALKNIKALYHGISYPSVIAIDRDLALLNALEKELPTSQVLLCIWHINKNVTKNCKSMFPTIDSWKVFYSQWEKIMYSTTEHEFECQWESMKEKFGTNSIPVAYLNNTWIPHKKRFVSCFANQYLHLGSHITSRVEGAHQTIKNYLDNSMGDLLVLIGSTFCG